MALEDKVISLNFGSGVDTKTDSKALMPGKLALLENGIFTRPKRVSKRNGYDELSLSKVGGGSLASIQAIKEYMGELVAAADGGIYSRSSSLSGWKPKGTYVSTEVINGVISSSSVREQYQTASYLGGYCLYAWTNSTSLYAAVVDTATGVKIYGDVEIDSKPAGLGSYDLAWAKTCVLGSSNLALLYINASNQLVLKILTIALGGISFGAEIALASDLCSLAKFDVSNLSTGAVIAYARSASSMGAQSSVKTMKVNTAGSVTASDIITTTAGRYSAQISTTVHAASGYILVSWALYLPSGPNSYSVNIATYNSSLSLLSQIDPYGSPFWPISQIAFAAVNPPDYGFSGTVAHKIYFTEVHNTSTIIIQIAFSNLGETSALSYLMQGCDLEAKPFSIGSKTFVPVKYYSFDYGTQQPIQNGIFLLDTSDSSVVAKALYNKTDGFRSNGYLPEVMSLSSTKVAWACGIFEGYQPILGSLLIANSVPQVATGFVQIDFAHADAYQAINVGDIQIWNGGLPTMYDGSDVVELGFLVFPEFASISVGGSGALADGTYLYYAVYQWYDDEGNLHQSAPSPAASVSVSGKGGVGSVTLVIKTLHLTRKKSPRGSVQIVVFRTNVNGTIARSVHGTSTITNDTNAPTIILTDGASDLSISESEMIYTTGGVVENIHPPPFLAMTSHNNRLWLIDSENKNTVWYSKSISPGFGVSTSDLLTVQVDSKFGNCVALASLDEKIVFQNDRGFMYSSGDGANDTGTGASISAPVPVPSEVGADSCRSFIVMPSGIILKTAKGFYLLDRSLNSGYIGSDVEAYNSQTFTSAVLIKDKNQVRFLSSTGSSLVYDYIMQQWSVFTNHTGLSADIWGGVYTYVTAGNKIYKENATSFLDGSTAYALRAKTAWIKLAGLQGFQRIRRLAMLGDYANGSSASHKVQICAAYDYGTSFFTPVQYAPGASGSTGVFQYRERLPIQKCESLQILIEEVTTGASGEYIDFTDLALEVAIKRGMNKFAQTKGVG